MSLPQFTVLTTAVGNTIVTPSVPVEEQIVNIGELCQGKPSFSGKPSSVSDLSCRRLSL
jgi:hypothetical protein